MIEQVRAFSETMDGHFDVETVRGELSPLELIRTQTERLDLTFHEAEESGVALQSVHALQAGREVGFNVGQITEIGAVELG